MNFRLVQLYVERHWTWKTVAVGLLVSCATVAVFNPYYLWENIRYTFTRPNLGQAEAASQAASAPTLAVSDLPVIGIRNSDLGKIQIGLGRSTGEDSDQDGLSNTLESAIGTSGSSRDTDGDGYDDRAEIINGYDPLSTGALALDARLAKKLAGKYLIQVEAHGELWYVDVADHKRYLLPVEAGQVKATVGGGAPAAPKAVSNQSKPESDKTYQPDTLYLPSLNITVPVKYVNEATEKAFQAALAGGVVQYPGTAMPGSYGNMYIFGHSSDYKWAKGSYKTVFATLPRIKLGAEVTVTDRLGTPYTYVVKEAKVVKATDTSYLSQYGFKEKLLTLQTSYPIGTALKRYVVIAEFKQ